MATAKQIAARKKFAQMAKSGAFKKKRTTKTKTKAKKVVKATAKKTAPKTKRAAPKKRKLRADKKWLCVFVKIDGKKYYDTGTNTLDTTKAKAERYPDNATAMAAARSIAKRLPRTHQGIFAEAVSGPK